MIFPTYSIMIFPNDPEAYVHRIGRTARAGKDGVAISLVTPGERRNLNRIEGYAKQQIPQAQLPTEEQINAGREKQLLEKMETWLDRDRCRREEEIVAKYVAEQGYDPIKVAAAALKLARVEEKQRPIEKIGEVSFEQRRNTHDKRRSSSGKGKGKNFRKQTQGSRGDGNRKSFSSQEKGMVRLKFKTRTQRRD